VARQDFLNGGFIGKMGNLVGERWKNKRYVRTYVVPHDPRTPDQLIVRTIFQRAIALSQQAMAINGHQGIWPTTHITEWQGRMAQCLRHLHAGDSDADSLPLYPDGYVADLIIRVTSLWRDEEGSLYIELDAATTSKACTVKLIMEYFASMSILPRVYEQIVNITVGQSQIIIPEPVQMAYAFAPSVTGIGNGTQPPNVGTVSIDPFTGPIGYEPSPSYDLGATSITPIGSTAFRINFRNPIPGAYDGQYVGVTTLAAYNDSGDASSNVNTGTISGGSLTLTVAPLPTRVNGRPLFSAGITDLDRPTGEPLIYFNYIEW
jgi:hypothetical protein